MDAKANAAYRAAEKARRVYWTWFNKTISGKIPVNKARGQRLAREMQRKLFAFREAAKPFSYPKS